MKSTLKTTRLQELDWMHELLRLHYRCQGWPLEVSIEVLAETLNRFAGSNQCKPALVLKEAGRLQFWRRKSGRGNVENLNAVSMLQAGRRA